uniref:DB domain-containing protein n=1 Tax=Loa loa TaxID=7209 RepID=A0A1I7VK19_LOALO
MSTTANESKISSAADKKLKQLVVGPQTVYKNGVNDGDTDLRNGFKMRGTSRKPLSRSLPQKRYLPAPTNSDANESLISMSSNEDDEVTEDVISLVTPKIAPNFGLEPFDTTLEPQSLFTTAQCGTAPDFSPCISISQANTQFEQCCRNKMLPAGCQHSCKYDVKESEISTIIGASFCAVLHIIPILQCASNGRDNSECCRYKQVATKSASRCEIFCRSGQEIARVGLEHLVCRKVMEEIIACHLSGLRN